MSVYIFQIIKIKIYYLIMFNAWYWNYKICLNVSAFCFSNFNKLLMNNYKYYEDVFVTIQHVSWSLLIYFGPASLKGFLIKTEVRVNNEISMAPRRKIHCAEGRRRKSRDKSTGRRLSLPARLIENSVRRAARTSSRGEHFAKIESPLNSF